MSTIFGGIFDFDLKSEKLEQVNAELEDPTVWDDPKRAQDLGKEKKSLEAIVESLTSIGSGLRDASDLLEMAREEGDDDTLIAVESDAHELQKQVEGMEFRRMFSNPLDKNSCFIDIQAGAGGTEAQDWASMLLRQYLRYCERKGFKTEILEQSDGDVAGIKTATIKVDGDHAYGFLRTETGVHRLVRKSPFDSANGRQSAPPSTNSSYSRFTSLLNFGNKPNILYNASEHTMMITMQQKDLEKTTQNKLTDFDNNGNRIIYKNTNIPLQKWNNFIINYNGGILDIFLNGELVKSEIGVVPYYTLDNLTIGEKDGIKGGICNVVYFRRALTRSNIYYLYNTVKNKTPPVTNDSNETILKNNVATVESSTKTVINKIS